jgi:hypothetical protein
MKLTYGTIDVDLADDVDVDELKNAISGAQRLASLWIQVKSRNGDVHDLFVTPGVPIMVTSSERQAFLSV